MARRVKRRTCMESSPFARPPESTRAAPKWQVHQALAIAGVRTDDTCHAASLILALAIVTPPTRAIHEWGTAWGRLLA